MTDSARQAPQRRILHLWLPFLATDRIRRLETAAQNGRAGPQTDDGPRATVEKVGGALVLAAVDARAREHGLAPALSLAEARARVPSLRVDQADPEADAATLAALARAADRYTPLVGLDPPCGLFLDVTGCTHLFGGESAMMEDMTARLARRGFTARAAVADSPAVAWAVARCGAGGVVLPGEGRTAIAPLPVAALRLPEETVAILSRLGLKTVGELLAQPRTPLVRRFGTLLARRIDQAEGRESEPITPLLPVAPFVVERAFAEPLAQAEALEAALCALAGRLCRTLEARGEGARKVRLALFRADGAVRDAEIGTSAPLADPERIARLFAPRIERLSARIESESGIDLVRLSAFETAPLAQRQETFDGTEALMADLSRLVDTLSTRLGAAAVQRLVPVDTHQPGEADGRLPARSALTPPPWPRPAADAFAGLPEEEGLPPARPLKLLDPPERVEALASVPDGPPVRFVWRRVAHHVAAAEGPERIAPDWWTSDPSGGLTCDYFRVEDTQGRRFWIFRRGLYGREVREPDWFVHGLFA